MGSEMCIRDRIKLEEIAKRVKEVNEDEQLKEPYKDLVISLAIDPEHPLKLGEEFIQSHDWMAANPKKAVKILDGRLPDWQASLTKNNSLKYARNCRKAWWEAITAHGVTVDMDQTDALILQSDDERNTRFREFWKKFENGEYAGAKDKKLQALLDKGEVGPVEQIVLLGCDQGLFLNAQEKYQLDAMEYLKGFEVEMNWELAEELISSQSWEVLNPYWENVLTKPLPKALESNVRIKSIYGSQNAEYLDVVALSLIHI